MDDVRGFAIVVIIDGDDDNDEVDDDDVVVVVFIVVVDDDNDEVFKWRCSTVELLLAVCTTPFVVAMRAELSIDANKNVWICAVLIISLARRFEIPESRFNTFPRKTRYDQSG